MEGFPQNQQESERLLDIVMQAEVMGDLQRVSKKLESIPPEGRQRDEAIRKELNEAASMYNILAGATGALGALVTAGMMATHDYEMAEFTGIYSIGLAAAIKGLSVLCK